jgi:hypothetical protein
LIRAFRELEIKADGCDISEYALRFAPEGCWDCTEQSSWGEHSYFGYTHIVIKDMLEHLSKEQLPKMLNNFSKVSKKMMCVLPIGDSGKYRIPEYHTEISHLIAENESWWKKEFKKCGWRIVKEYAHLPGLKDNWMHVPDGNHVFVLEHK